MSINEICLSPNAIADLIDGKLRINPILQITNVKSINNLPKDKDNSSCYRVTISDGNTTYSSCILNSSLNELVASGDLKENTIVRIKQIIRHVLDEESKRIMLIINELDILRTDTDKRDSVNSSKTSQPMKSTNELTSTTSKSFELASSIDSPTTNSIKQSETETVANKTPMLISQLNTFSNQWIIKGIVTNKTKIHHFNNAQREGSVFSFDVCDGTDEIRLTVFNHDCTRFHSMIQTGHSYEIANAVVKPVNHQYNKLSANFELFLTRDTIINECFMDTPVNLTTSRYHFIKLCNIQNQSKDTVVDVIGVVIRVLDPCVVVNNTDHKSYVKRTIHLIDETCSMPVTLWQEQATQFNEVNAVVVFQGVKIHEFNAQRALSVTPTTYIKYNPSDTPRTEELSQWYKHYLANYGNDICRNIPKSNDQEYPYKSFIKVLVDYVTDHKKLIYFRIRATCVHIDRDNFIYKMCPVEGCGKKIIENKNNHYFCSKCHMKQFEFKWGYMALMKISDSGTVLPVMFFNQQVEKLVGQSAAEIAVHFLKMIGRMATKITNFFHDDHENSRNIHQKRSVNLISPSTPSNRNSTITDVYNGTIISTCHSLKKMKIDTCDNVNEEDQNHHLNSLIDIVCDDVFHASLLPLSSPSSHDQSSLSHTESLSVDDEIFKDDKIDEIDNIQEISKSSNSCTTLIMLDKSCMSIGTQTLSKVTLDASTQTVNDTYISAHAYATTSVIEETITDEDIVKYLTETKYINLSSS